jgi:hypothetical protein
MRNIEIKCYLTDEELKQVQSCADRELSDSGLWMRRVAVSAADGSANIGVNPQHPANKMDFA